MPAPLAPATAPRALLPWLEACRTVLMAGVVLVHVNLVAAPEVSTWWPLGDWSCLPLGLLVPAFFLLSGLVTGLGDDPGAPFDARRFLGRKVRSLLVPMLLWSALTLGVARLCESPVFPATTGELLFRLGTGFWHLYFLPALLQCFLLYALLRRHLQGRGLALAAVGAVLVSALFYGLASGLFWAGVRHDGFFEDYLDRTFAPWCGCFFVGVALGRSRVGLERLARLAPLLLLATLAAFPLFLWELRREVGLGAPGESPPLLQFLAGGFPFQVLGALAYVGLFAALGHISVAAPVLRGVARLAPYSLGVYLCHNSIFVPLLRLWTRSAWPEAPGVAVPALWASTLLLALGAAFAGRRLGWPGRLLFGARPNLRAQDRG